MQNNDLPFDLSDEVQESLVKFNEVRCSPISLQ